MSKERDRATNDFYRDPDSGFEAPKEYDNQQKMDYLDQLMKLVKQENQTRVGEP